MRPVTNRQVLLAAIQVMALLATALTFQFHLLPQYVGIGGLSALVVLFFKTIELPQPARKPGGIEKRLGAEAGPSLAFGLMGSVAGLWFLFLGIIFALFGYAINWSAKFIAYVAINVMATYVVGTAATRRTNLARMLIYTVSSIAVTCTMLFLSVFLAQYVGSTGAL